MPIVAHKNLERELRERRGKKPGKLMQNEGDL